MKSMRSKKVWLTAFLATAFTLFGAGVAMMDSVDVSANNVVTAESVGLVMDKGAGVRLGTSDGNNGIRFILTMNKTEYNSLMEKVGTEEDDLYSEISFGMLITKASYVTDAKELTVENVFGNNAVFEWKPEGADENWKVSEGKTLVVNQTFGYLGTAADYENDYVGFASLVSLHDYNLTQEFIGRGYMKYTAKDGSVSYRMADYYENARANNVRSMVYVAQKASEDPEMSEYKDTLNSLYINHSTVQAETVDVTIKHHKVDVHGKDTVETEIVTGQKIGATATAQALESEEWIYDASKSTASGVVYANNKTVLDLYYNQNPEVAYDLWHVGEKNAVEKTIALDKTVTGGVRYDTAEVKLNLDLVNGTMPRIKFYLLNTNGAQITDPAEFGWITVAEGENTLTATFKWATGNWDVGAIKIIVEDGSYRLGVDVDSITIQEVAYQLEYSVASGSQQKLYTFDKVAGGAQNGYVKVTFDVAVFQGNLTNIQFNLCTDTAGKTTVANSNMAWAEDGTKIASSGGQISMNNLAGKKTVTIVTTFPWASGNWDLQSIQLQLYGTNLKAGVSNIQVELVPDFTTVA